MNERDIKNTLETANKDPKSIQTALMPLAALLVDEFFKQNAKNKEKKDYEKLLQQQPKGGSLLPGVHRRTSKNWGEPF